MGDIIKKEPQIRFDSFSDAWEQRELGELLDLLKDGTHGTHKDVNDGIYLLSAKNIKNGKVFIDHTDRRISKDEYNSIHKNFVLKKNDILLTIVGSIGEVAILENPENITFQRSVAYLRASKKLTPQFLLTKITGEEFQRELKIRQVVSAQPGIYLGDLSVIPLLLPLNIREQQQIGSFFKQLDNLITLHQRKLENLKNTKKCLLRKMFPKDGEIIPDLRFAGFTDAWEQRKLGELGSVEMNKRIYKEQTSNCGDIPFYKIGTFGGKPDAFITRDLYEEYKSKYPYPKMGDILISASGSIGKIVVYSGENEYFQDSNIVWLNHENRIDNSFLKCFYSFVKWEGLEGSTIKRLYNSNILNTIISLPSLSEQKDIGSFFNQLDNLITLHQRKYDKLINMKKSLLAKMFL